MACKMFTGFLLLISSSLYAQQDSAMIRSLANDGLTNGRAYDNLRVLTKEVGARLSGSPQMYAAEAWGAQALKEAGADSVWLQACMVPHWVRGGKDEAAVFTGDSQRGIPLQVIGIGNAVGTGEQGIAAPVLLINSFEELEARKNEVKGKIVFYNYKFKPTFIRTFAAYGDAVKYRGQGASDAAKYGAVAVLVRSMSESTDNVPHTGALHYDSTLPMIPAAAVGLQDADNLAALLQADQQVRVWMKTNARMLPDTLGHNVIGEWKGSAYPDQVITIGGHLDSWDVGEGAHDDGAGCVQSIEVLRLLKAAGYQPKHTIRIVLFANEENGLRGGEKYAEEAKANNEQHFFALESDAGGFTPRSFGFKMPAEKLAAIQPWAKLLAPYGIAALSGGGGGADVGPLNRSFGTPVAGLEPDSQRYFDVHHSANDVLENVNKRELELGAINMAALVYLVDKYGL